MSDHPPPNIPTHLYNKYSDFVPEEYIQVQNDLEEERKLEYARLAAQMEAFENAVPRSSEPNRFYRQRGFGGRSSEIKNNGYTSNGAGAAAAGGYASMGGGNNGVGGPLTCHPQQQWQFSSTNVQIAFGGPVIGSSPHGANGGHFYDPEDVFVATETGRPRKRTRFMSNESSMFENGAGAMRVQFPSECPPSSAGIPMFSNPSGVRITDVSDQKVGDENGEKMLADDDADMEEKNE